MFYLLTYQGPFAHKEQIGSDHYARAIRSAAQDDEVKAIIIRINSRGGGASASDKINHEVVRAKKKKPVYVYMHSIAASGAYWISMDANKIVAQRGTITGSIGVFILKLNFQKFLANKLGITFDDIATNKASKLLSAISGWTKEEEESINKNITIGYNMFLERVSKGRNIDIEKVRKIAKGRVYTGVEALELGLVDALGDFNVLLNIVKKDLKIPEKDSICLKIYPRPLSFMDLILPHQPKNSIEQDKKGRPTKLSLPENPVQDAASGLYVIGKISSSCNDVISRGLNTYFSCAQN